MVDRDWARDCPRLSELVATVHQLFDGPARRQFLHDQLAGAIRAKRTAEDSDWHEQRRRYFEETAVVNLELRDGYRGPAGLVWQDYIRDVRESKAPSLSSLLIGEGFYKPRPGCVSIVEPHPGRDRFVGEVRIKAWAPAEFLGCHKPEPQFPLPAANIGRDYDLFEICFALAILHDAHGGYEPFVPDDHCFSNDSAWWLPLTLLSKNAKDKWAPTLYALLPRVEAALKELDLSEADVSTGIGSDRKPKQPTKNGDIEATRRLLTLFTNGVADVRIGQAAALLQDNNLTTSESLEKLDAIIPLPATASAEKLGDLFGVTKQAVIKTEWWKLHRQGEDANETGRRRDAHKKRATQHESNWKSDD